MKKFKILTLFLTVAVLSVFVLGMGKNYKKDSREQVSAQKEIKCCCTAKGKECKGNCGCDCESCKVNKTKCEKCNMKKGSKDNDKSEKADLATAKSENKFTDFDFKNLNGKEIETNDLREGKFFLLKLGTTWCPACNKMTEDLKELNKVKGKYNLEILDVFLEESKETVEKYVKAKNVEFNVGLDEEGEIGKQFNVSSIPVVMLIDKKGEIVYQGYYTPKDRIIEMIDALKSKKKDSSVKDKEMQKTKDADICPMCGNPKGKCCCTK